MNPAVLTRVDAQTTNGSSFGVGDTVRISSDLERVIELQKGHGEWINAMAPVNFEIIYTQLILNILLKVL